MRTAFIQALIEEAARDERVWLLTGDLGYSVLEPFAERFPDRFLNVGIAEQNMTGIAAGLAMTGKIPFTYSIGNFPTLRCLEQIRNDVCYHELPVRVVSVGGGLAYGSLGYSHHGLEDLAILRTLPDMAVVAPGDPHETRAMVRGLIHHPGPAYLRLGKANEPVIHGAEPSSELGKAIVVREGSDLTLASTGGILAMTMAAAAELESQGVSVRVLSFPCVEPLDVEAISCALSETRGLVTLEEHGPGGLAGAIAELAVQHGWVGKIQSLHLPKKPVHHAGSQDALRELGGLSVSAVVARGNVLLAA